MQAHTAHENAQTTKEPSTRDCVWGLRPCASPMLAQQVILALQGLGQHVGPHEIPLQLALNDLEPNGVLDDQCLSIADLIDQMIAHESRWASIQT